MKKWLMIGSIAVLVAMLGVVAMGTAAFAQGPTGATAPMYGRTLGLGMGGFGGPQNSLVAVAAKVLGMDHTALVNELNAGKTIADVAKTKNVAVDKIVNAFVDARSQVLKASVDAKRITQAQADSTLASIKAQAQKDVIAKLTPHTYGMGRGAGMRTGFVDANKDGICDNCGANQSTTGQFLGPRWSR
ncbi:MAG: hypothetical protein HZB51_27975 [Chloroflexi bacterium]|nr:hypothetical protein [Chloroflexota bacterium]